MFHERLPWSAEGLNGGLEEEGGHARTPEPDHRVPDVDDPEEEAERPTPMITGPIVVVVSATLLLVSASGFLGRHPPIDEGTDVTES